MIFMTEYFIFKLGCSNSEKSAKIRRKQQTYSRSEEYVKPGTFP